MKIAMIGASGFVGTRLINLLKEEPAKYTCSNIDLQPSHFFNEITTIGDVRSQEQMDRELKGADVVILLAAAPRRCVARVAILRHQRRGHGSDSQGHGEERHTPYNILLVGGCLRPQQEESR